MDVRFKIVSRALRDVFGIKNENAKAFAARLNNFRRLGVPEGVNLGKGRQASYGLDQRRQLALALELCELGLLPDTVVPAITQDNWRALSDMFERAGPGSDKRFLCVHLRMLFPDTGKPGVYFHTPLLSADEAGDVLALAEEVGGRRHVFIDLARLAERVDTMTERATREEAAA